MCVFKGRHRCRCYNPNKPEKWHFKAFCLNDSGSGYLHRFYMYQGSTEQRPNDITATLYPSYKLLGNEEYHNTGHVLHTDNWFTSLPELVLCRQRGIHCIGTVKTNKQHLPQDAIFPKTGGNRKNRGDMQCMQAQKDGHNYYFISWMDSKPVHLLSTYAGYKITCKRGVSNPLGGFHRVELPQPSHVRDYNDGMGGTDVGDQKASYYRFQHKARSWIRRIFSHFAQTAQVDAHILYTEHRGGKLTFLQCLHQLMYELAGEVEPDDIEVEDSDAGEMESIEEEEVEPTMKRAAAWASDHSRIVPTHTPKVCTGECGFCRTGCQTRTQIICVECKAWLCCNDEGEDNCWHQFHNDPAMSKPV